MTRRRRKNRMQQATQWYKSELHIHTPASADFQQRDITILDILQQAERKDIDILAFTDHNTIAGYQKMQDDVEQLELLENLNRLNAEETKRLTEYRRLSSKILLLKGFEFTATFGFHIIGIFPPETRLRDLEFLLLSMNVPAGQLDEGATEVGATCDVLTAYQKINEAGGIVIAAHANSSHGVALHGLNFGGQTRIAFTQDPHLHALEVTDLEKTTKKSTIRFFDGTKPEYPRRMRCIQGSDAHRLTRDPNNARNLGIGERVTEILLAEKTFKAIYDVFSGNDFARTRPYRPEAHPFDYIQAAREDGPTIVQEFHEQYGKRGGYQDAIIADICAFANTNGGMLYVGVTSDPQQPPTGVSTSPIRVQNLLTQEIQDRIAPELKVTVDVQETQGVKVIRIVVPRGESTPYTMDESHVYIRSETETTLAVRDEIVALVKRGMGYQAELTPPEPEISTDFDLVDKSQQTEPPRTGVEIASVETRNNTRYYTLRDLRNGNLVKNVTKHSARYLWRYAIEQYEDRPVQVNQVKWLGDIGIWNKRTQSKQVRFDLVQRQNGKLRIYYGVTEAGIHSKWLALLGE
jgi:hypothetical protein